MRQSTETTTLMISVGRPGELEDGDRLVVDGHAEDAAEDLRHAVVDGERAEHEGIARVETDGLERVLTLR